MDKIIIKKNREKNSIGFFKPIFIEQEDKIQMVKYEDFPNGGEIYIPRGIEGFESNKLFYINREDLTENFKYREQLTSYKENPSLQNPCKFITYDNKIKKMLPTELIPVYRNLFNVETQKLGNTQGINNEVFFLEKNASIWGPFKKNSLKLSPFNFRSEGDNYEDNIQFDNFLDIYIDYDGEYIFELPKDEVFNCIIVDSDKNTYLTDFKSIVEKKIGKPILFSDDTTILEWGKKKIEAQNPDFSNTLISFVNNYSTENSDKDKWKRFRELIEHNSSELSLTKDVLLKKGLEENKESEEYNRNIEAKSKEIEAKSEEIVELKETISQLREQLNDLKHSHDDNIDSTLDYKSYPFLNEALKNPVQLEEILERQENYEKIKSEIHKLEGKKEYLDTDIRKLEKRKSDIESSVKDIVETFKKSAAEHTTKLAEAKIYTDLLNGIEIEFYTPKASVNKISVLPNIRPATQINAKEYVSEIQKRLEIQGRNISFNDVANLIITTNQSFLTILAGAPGIGKTSLVERLSKSFGLSEKFGYLEISCAKGWTSSKDLIGFYNPLSKKFQSSKTKLKEALENSQAYPQSPYIVLLDEANLSPMEHYWSDFIKLADLEYGRKINISDTETIKFGNGFRFLATINHDHTTEMLSNRLLDRATIIQIEKPNKLEEIVPNFETPSEILDFQSVKDLFKETSKWKAEETTITQKLNSIIDKLEVCGLTISPRKLSAVKNYLRVATGLLEGEDYTALDYAVAQQLLPIINLRGDYEVDLNKVYNEFLGVGMEKSKRLLDKIIKKGKEFKHFKYLYY